MSRFLSLAFLIVFVFSMGCSDSNSRNVVADATQEELDEYARLVAESEVAAGGYKLEEGKSK